MSIFSEKHVNFVNLEKRLLTTSSAGDRLKTPVVHEHGDKNKRLGNNIKNLNRSGNRS